MDAAREVMGRHLEAINARDVEAYRRTMNFPFTYQNYNGVALTIANASDCGVSAPLPWEIIASTDQDWHHTTFDNVEAVARSVSSVVWKVEFSRVDVSRHAYGAYHAIWIATCQGGRWGVQFRHNLGLREP
jgi:hypothetical protein